MSVDERSRLQLAEAAKRVFGADEGITLMELLPPVGWADVATPGFVAGLLIQIATVITAIFVGAPGAEAALDQANKNTDMANASTRAALGDPPDLGKVDPKRFVGRAPEQVDEFLAEVVEPLLADAADDEPAHEDVRV